MHECLKRGNKEMHPRLNLTGHVNEKTAFTYILAGLNLTNWGNSRRSHNSRETEDSQEKSLNRAKSHLDLVSGCGSGLGLLHYHHRTLGILCTVIAHTPQKSPAIPRPKQSQFNFQPRFRKRKWKSFNLSWINMITIEYWSIMITF